MILSFHGVWSHGSVTEFLFGSPAATKKKHMVLNYVEGNSRNRGKSPIMFKDSDKTEISNRNREYLQSRVLQEELARIKYTMQEMKSKFAIQNANLNKKLDQISRDNKI